MLKFREIFPLYAVIFLGFFGYALTITLFIPMIMDHHFLLVPADTSVNVRALLSGFLLAMYPLGQFFGSPIIGNFSDYFGRKKVLLISLIACFFGFTGIGLSIRLHLLIPLFITSFLTGLCESNMAISQTIIADRTDNTAEKTKLIGYAYSACSLGYIVGPLLGGTGSVFGYSTPFWITAIGVLLLTIWIAYRFHDNFTPNKHVPIKLLTSLIAVRSIFNKPNLKKIYLINFLIFFAVQGLYRVIPLYVVDTWKPSLEIYAILIAFVSLLCFLTNLSLLGALSKRFSTQKLLAGLLIIGGIFVIIVVLPDHFNWIWLTYGLAVIPTVMALPTCTTWLSQQVSSHEQGQVLGNNQALLVLGEATSAAIGGGIAALLIPLPVVVMGVILFITAGMVIKSNISEGTDRKILPYGKKDEINRDVTF